MNCGSCVTQNNSLNSGSCLSPDLRDKTDRHPCYSQGAHHKYARMHLPVAPHCNISCNYCNRKFDCVNESRPGVTSEVLTPSGAWEKFMWVREKIENLSVVGIAGPGDALANWENTKKAIELVRQSAPETIFCLSTNGLRLPDYAAEIIELGVKHVTVTVNCLDPEIGRKIYRFVNYKGQKLEGAAGAAVLINNQLAGIKYLAENGALVKVNIVMVKGVNDTHIPAVVKKVKEQGAFMTNIMPLIPAPGSAFENYPQTSMKELNNLRQACGVDLKQMYHCKQCRADAIGLLGEDRSLEFSAQSKTKVADNTENPGALKESSTAVKKKEIPAAKVGFNAGYKIAVASKYGRLVDLHFGHATEFTIYRTHGEAFELIEKRPVEKYCSGMEECDAEESREKIIGALMDCDAVLTMRIGYQAKERLAKKGILSIESCDTVEKGLSFAVQAIEEKQREIA